MTGLPDPITLGVYETRGGHIAHVTKIDRRMMFSVRGAIKNMPVDARWREDGRFWAGVGAGKTILDLIRRIGDLP